METKLIYIRLKGDTFGFVTNEAHEILDTDIPISEEDYNEFFKKQSNGISFRLKENVILSEAKGLFDYVEPFMRDLETLSYEPTETDILKEEMTELKKLVEQLLNK